MDEVVRSLGSDAIDDLTSELAELGLLEHCRATLERRRTKEKGRAEAERRRLT